jgi:hypothetical protein
MVCLRLPRRPLAAVLAALLALILLPAASARQAVNAATRPQREAGPIFSDPVAEAVGRAVEYWGGTPCGGTVDVVTAVNSEAPTAGQNAPGAPGHVAAMWATWLTPGGPNLFTEPASSFGECVVHVNRGIWPSTQAEDANFGAFCKEMLHEYGHFDGHPDVGAAAFTIEYERPDLAHVPLCERYRLYYGHRLYSRPAAKAEPHAGGRRSLSPT